MKKPHTPGIEAAPSGAAVFLTYLVAIGRWPSEKTVGPEPSGCGFKLLPTIGEHVGHAGAGYPTITSIRSSARSSQRRTLNG